MSYWTKRHKINASVAKQIANISQNDCEGAESKELPSVSAPTMDVFDNDALNSEATACKNIVDIIHSLNDEWLDDELGDGSESDDNSPDSDSADIVDQMRRWTAAASVKQDALSELLNILRSHIPELPKDARTLLYTPTTLDLLPHMKNISGGLYYHFGISDSVKIELQGAGFTGCVDTLSFQINIDGVPLFKSSSGQFWPILGKLVVSSLGQPFVTIDSDL